jgi:hypothetical protein
MLSIPTSMLTMMRISGPKSWIATTFPASQDTTLKRSRFQREQDAVRNVCPTASQPVAVPGRVFQIRNALNGYRILVTVFGMAMNPVPYPT